MTIVYLVLIMCGGTVDEFATVPPCIISKQVFKGSATQCNRTLRKKPYRRYCIETWEWE